MRDSLLMVSDPLCTGEQVLIQGPNLVALHRLISVDIINIFQVHTERTADMSAFYDKLNFFLLLLDGLLTTRMCNLVI